MSSKHGMIGMCRSDRRIELVQFVALAISLMILAGFWMARGRLNGLDLGFLAWNRTPAFALVKAIGLGLLAALLVSGAFRDLRTGPLPPLAEIWMGITFGPLVEELIFRGILFHGLMHLLWRWFRNPGWLVVIAIAAAFALSHMVKAGITPWQLATIFLTGSLYGWLRLESGSTVPPFCAHVAYNAFLFGAAFVR
jgi:membrane protease YdiL (CAAX protease family)